jgi:hypothetical protein
MPEWAYYFHGRGCCIPHKVDGDAIGADFWDDTAEYFDPFFQPRQSPDRDHPLQRRVPAIRATSPHAAGRQDLRLPAEDMAAQYGHMPDHRGCERELAVTRPNSRGG